jgi:hypothetical protein
MGLIEPLAIAAPLPSSVLLLGSSSLRAAALTGALSIAAIGLCDVLAHRQRRLPALRLAYSTAA